MKKLLVAVFVMSLVLGSTAVALAKRPSVAGPAGVVLAWNVHAIEALANPGTAAVPGAGQTPPVSVLHMAMVQGAVYDAVNAIERGGAPFVARVRPAQRWASIDAAAATAAHHVLVGLVPALPPAVITRLDGLHAATIASLPPGKARAAGVRIGARAAAAMLAERADDGRYATGISMPVGSEAGDWRPTPPGFVNDPFAWVSQVRPFVLDSGSQFRSAGPPDLTSATYTAEYNEVKTLGRLTGSTRTPAQQAIADFFQEHIVILWNRTLRTIAVSQGLDNVETARLLAMTNVSAADSVITCWGEKVDYHFWRPVTAIQLGDDDGNAATVGEPTWLPMVTTPPYPDSASGFNCGTAGFLRAARNFFGTDNVSFTVHSNISNTDRSYTAFSAVLLDSIEARIYQGIHFRSADVQGAGLGRTVADYVAGHAFQLR